MNEKVDSNFVSLTLLTLHQLLSPVNTCDLIMGSIITRPIKHTNDQKELHATRRWGMGEAELNPEGLRVSQSRGFPKCHAVSLLGNLGSTSSFKQPPEDHEEGEAAKTLPPTPASSGQSAFSNPSLGTLCRRSYFASSEKQQVNNRHGFVLILLLLMGTKSQET